MQERVLKEQLLPCRREPNDLTDPPNKKTAEEPFLHYFLGKTQTVSLLP